jgi:hypothetical protein
MEILEILKYTLPALIVFFTAFFLIKYQVDLEKRRLNANMAMKNQEIITPLRLQAYERVILLLERISPDSLIMRINKSGMTSKQLHTELLKAIRAEFDHNLSQQIYLSTKTWQIVKKARQDITKLINSTAIKVESQAPSMKLSQLILESVMESEKSSSADAIEYVKREIQQLF